MTQASNLSGPTGQTIIGVFDNLNAAERAINDLKITGFTPDSVSILTRDNTTAASAADTTDIERETEGNEAGKGAVTGALGGGTLGAVLGWVLAGGAAVVIPGIGPIIAAGILGATVTGALVGGSVGSISAALAGSGIPEEHAQAYEEHIRGGRTVVSAAAPNGLLAQNARDVFERNNAIDIRDYGLNAREYNVPIGTPDAFATTPTPMPGGTAYVPSNTTTSTINPVEPTDTNNDNFRGGANTGIETGANYMDTNDSSRGSTDGSYSVNTDNPTQNSQSTGAAPAGATGTGPQNQTYNQPPAGETYTPGTRYSAPFNDRQLNQNPTTDVTDVAGRPINTPLEGADGQPIDSPLPGTDTEPGLPVFDRNPGGIGDRSRLSERGRDATNFEPINEKPLGNI